MNAGGGNLRINLGSRVGRKKLLLAQFLWIQAVNHAHTSVYLFPTAPGQRAGGCAGSQLWQGIHPSGAGCLSEGGGWCGHCPGSQIPLSSCPMSWWPLEDPTSLYSIFWTSGNNAHPQGQGFCLIKDFQLNFLVHFIYFIIFSPLGE